MAGRHHPVRRCARTSSAKTGAGAVTTHFRVEWANVHAASWFGLPHHSLALGANAGWHRPVFNGTFILLVLPSVIALIAENTEHVKAVGESLTALPRAPVRSA
jgi:xanthine/uracil permease